MNNIRRMLMWRGLLRFDVVHVALLHMIVVLTPPGRLDACMMTGMAVGVLVRQVEVASIL
jgi:hypothetical protein